MASPLDYPMTSPVEHPLLSNTNYIIRGAALPGVSQVGGVGRVVWVGVWLCAHVYAHGNLSCPHLPSSLLSILLLSLLLPLFPSTILSSCVFDFLTHTWVMGSTNVCMSGQHTMFIHT